jgi:hypothetical protein
MRLKCIETNKLEKCILMPICLPINKTLNLYVEKYMNGKNYVKTKENINEKNYVKSKLIVIFYLIKILNKLRQTLMLSLSYV